MAEKNTKKNRNTKEAEIEKARAKRVRSMQNKQVMWAIVLMTVLIVIVVLVPVIKKNFIDKFVYANLDFQKTQLGKINFYSTVIPIVEGDKIIGTYSMNFRSNPKKSDYINVEIPYDIIKFAKNESVYIVLDPEMEACEDNSLALINFAGFLRDFANLEIKSAVDDREYAKQNNLTYASCGDFPKNTVIEITSGESSEIRELKNNCYRLVYKDCEIIPVTEKFIFIILEKYMSYFTRE